MVTDGVKKSRKSTLSVRLDDVEYYILDVRKREISTHGHGEC